MQKANEETVSRASRIRGCIMGGAIGDALGAPIEFASYDEIISTFGTNGIVDYVENANGVGEFTDDTQMTLFTVEGLIRYIIRGTLRGVSSLEMVMHHAYQRWMYTQGEVVNSIYYDKISPKENGWLMKEPILQKRRAPGLTCLSALSRDLKVDRELGSPDYRINDSKGCGGVMRVAPIAFFTSSSFETGVTVAALTHTHPTGYIAAGFFAEVIKNCCYGVNIRESVTETLQYVKDNVSIEKSLETIDAVMEAVQLAEEYLSGIISFSIPECINQLGGGWIAEEALAITIFVSIVFENDFEKGVLAAVNHSGDSDSTGSMVGQLLGVRLGEKVLPQKWIDNLVGNTVVETICTDIIEQTFYKFSTYGVMTDELNSFWERYPGW